MTEQLQASVIGKKFGRRPWFDLNKTVEGSIAFALSVTACGLGLYLAGVADSFRVRFSPSCAPSPNLTHQSLVTFYDRHGPMLFRLQQLRVWRAGHCKMIMSFFPCIHGAYLPCYHNDRDLCSVPTRDFKPSLGPKLPCAATTACLLRKIMNVK